MTEPTTATIDTAPQDVRYPTTRQTALAALSIRRGTGKNRLVHWRHINTRVMNPVYPIHVHPGNVLQIRVFSGLPRLIVESGHVEIEFWSVWGNALTIQPGASAHVITDSDTKVTIENDGTLTLEAPARNRVYIYGAGDITTQTP